MSDFPSLFAPLRIGTVTVRNRIVQPAHAKLYSQQSADTERDLKYHVARARGGCSLLITGERLVHPTSSTGRSRFTYAYLASSVEADRKITAAVHDHGAAIFAQLNHKGVEGGSDSADDLRVLYAPSAVSSPASGESPKVMEHEDIADIVSSWARSAEHSREGGFDGAELHLATAICSKSSCPRSTTTARTNMGARWRIACGLLGTSSRRFESASVETGRSESGLDHRIRGRRPRD